VLNPPSIFWIMFLGGYIAACAWMPVALASVLSKRVTKTGAFLGMLFGLLGCLCTKVYSSLSSVSLPPYLDPGFVGIVCNILALVVGSALTKVTPEEAAARKILLVVPESEKSLAEVRKTKRWSIATIFIGVFFSMVLLTLWVIPYYQGLAI